MTPEAVETPLLDLLRDVPADAQLSYEHSPTCHQHIPVGVLAAKTADEIERLRAEVEALRHIIARCKSIMEGGEGVTDQGEAWDRTKQLLDAAVKAAMAKEKP